MERCPRLIGRLLPLLIVLCCLSARAAQMEGPTVYEVEPTLAVITDDGSEAYYVDNGALSRLDLKQSISGRIDLDGELTSKEFALAGFAPTGELVGYSKAKVWGY